MPVEEVDILDFIVNFESLKIPSNSKQLSSALYKQGDESKQLQLEKEISACQSLMDVLASDKMVKDEACDKQSIFSSDSVCEKVVLPFLLNRLVYIIQGTLDTENKLQVREKYLEAYLKLLVECLSMISVSSLKESNVLSQSILQKIVPYVSSIAYEKGNRDAAFLFQFFCENLFKPSLTVCENLLIQHDKILLSKQHTKSEIDRDCLNSIKSSLSLFFDIQVSVNPKKVFQMISSAQFLPMLSRMSQLSDTHNLLVQKIIYNGIFDAEHHLEGYQSAFHVLDPNSENVSKVVILNICFFNVIFA